MAEMVPDAILVRLDRTFREVERLITSDGNYALAREQLRAMNVNLDRILNILPMEMYNSLKGCAQHLFELCNDGEAAEANGVTAVEVEEPGDGTRQLEEGESHTRSSSFSAPRTNSGKRGRPKVEITREQLITLQKSGYTAKRMAAHFGCSPSLVYKKLHAEGMKIREKYSTLSDEELKTVIADLHREFPNTGSEMMSGLLHARGHTVQRTRVRKLLAEVDPPSAAERWGNGVSRRVYKVASPNSLWHMDGHMKLIRWGLVTNGCIDGFSRLVTFLKCSPKNSAKTVLELFLKATQMYAMPSRVRSDHGHENVLVALFMNLTYGPERASHITGESVHNVRIERLWRDVYKDVIASYYNEFYALEDEGVLDPSDDVHRFSLHAVYLEHINEHLSTFQHAWNHHRVRTERNRTPEQIWRDGMLESSLDNAAVSRVFEAETSWEDVVEDMLRRYHLSDLPHGNEPQDDDTSNISSRLSQMQKEELDLIVAANGELRDKYRAYSEKVAEYMHL